MKYGFQLTPNCWKRALLPTLFLNSKAFSSLVLVDLFFSILSFPIFAPSLIRDPLNMDAAGLAQTVI